MQSLLAAICTISCVLGRLVASEQRFEDTPTHSNHNSALRCISKLAGAVSRGLNRCRDARLSFRNIAGARIYKRCPVPPPLETLFASPSL